MKNTKEVPNWTATYDQRRFCCFIHDGVSFDKITESGAGKGVISILLWDIITQREHVVSPATIPCQAQWGKWRSPHTQPAIVMTQ